LPSQLTYLWREPKVAKSYRSAVSLHGHTNSSREGLDFIGDYARRNPLLRAALATQERRAWTESRIEVDFHKAHWRPPLTPVAAFRLEREQIERALGIEAMVSLSDHDNIEAPLLLRQLAGTSEVPISVEWTLPYKDTTLHIGIHNLPGECAERMMAQLTDYTKDPAENHLEAIFQQLHGMTDVLVVLNHPMWDLAGIGKQRHAVAIHDFAGQLGTFIHAFELGGFRSWKENQAVLEFAEGCGQIVIGGGDRHGAEPSAVLNLTNAESFAEFVYEVRRKRTCHLLFMPQYRESRTLRMLQSLLDIVREYPEQPEGWRRWEERVFHPDRTGVLRPVGSLWKKTPGFIKGFFSAVRLLEVPPIRKLLQAALAKPEHEMRLVPGRGREVSQWTKAYGSRSFQIHTTKSTVWRTPAGSLRRSPKGADSPS
jgi:hypothetical protein